MKINNLKKKENCLNGNCVCRSTLESNSCDGSDFCSVVGCENGKLKQLSNLNKMVVLFIFKFKGRCVRVGTVSYCECNYGYVGPRCEYPFIPQY